MRQFGGFVVTDQKSTESRSVIVSCTPAGLTIRHENISIQTHVNNITSCAKLLFWPGDFRHIGDRACLACS